MQRPLAAVVFDMDGLMFNTEDIYDLVGQKILEKRGHNFGQDLKLKMMGRTEPDAYRILKQECGIQDSIEQLQAENNQLLRALIPDHIRKLPGLDQVMKAGRDRGLKLGVATSSGLEMADAKLAHFQMRSHFDQIVTGDEVTQGKPDPEIYFEIATRLKIAPESMLVFEDSQAGARAASAAGALTVAVPGKHCQHLDYPEAHLVVDRLDAPPILEILQTCPIA